MRRQRGIAAALAFALVTSGAIGSSAVADDLKDKKSKVQKNIKRAKTDLDESSARAAKARSALTKARADLKSAQAKLSSTRGELATAKARDTAMQAKLVVAERELETAQAKLAEGKKKLADQRRLVGRIAVASATRPSPQLMGLVSVFEARSVSTLIDDMQAVDSMVSHQDKVLSDFREAKSQLVVREASVEKATDAVATQRKAAAANLVLRTRLERDAETARASVADLVGKRAGAQREAIAARKADQAELVKLRRENRRIESMLAARAGKAVDQGNSGGPLLRPVTGYVTSPYGWRKHPIYGYWGLHDGTDFHAPCGTPLRASGNGTVVQEYFQSAWGNRLILDLGRVKGRGVSVIYNHISTYKVGSGAKVKRGDVVAYAGTTGWSTACHLHFTVMVDGKPQNPMNWF